MSENKFMKHLRGEDTAKSLIEVKNQNTVTRFVGVPHTTDNMNDVYSDHRGNATGVLKGTENWVLKAGGLNLVSEVHGDGSDFIDSFFVSGSSMWLQNSYTFPGDKIFLPNTKFVLKLCGNNLRSQKEAVHFALLIEFSDGTIVHKKFDIRRQSGNFCKEFIVDFDESNTNLVRLSAGDRMIVSLLADDSSASAEIYNGMSVFTALQRRVDSEVVASETLTFEDVANAIGDLHTAVDGKVDRVGDTMTGPLKFKSGSFSGAISGYFNGVSFYKLDANNNVVLIGSFRDTDLSARNTGTADLGTSSIKWRTLYALKLNNGADLAIPTQGGTLARIEDVPVDISDLSDVQTTSPQVGDYLRWNGQYWYNAAGSSGATVNWGQIGGNIADQPDLQNGFDAKANVNMDNLTSVGQNIANWSHNVTNCIAEVPQDIKLELNAGVLTVKAGSKIYVPNGFDANNDPIFNVITLTNDVSVSFVNPYTYDDVVICLKSDGTAPTFFKWTPNDVSSGTTPSQYSFCYRTDLNKLYDYEADTTTPYEELSLPICICSFSNNTITSIKQIFNGFGYIGTTTFVLPGVKALVPNGRNADGTCNNTELSFTEVKVHTLDYSNEVSKFGFLGANGIEGYGVYNYFEQDTKPVFSGTYATWFDTKNNIIIGTSDGGSTWGQYTRVYLGALYKDPNANINNFNPRTVFRAVDSNDIVDDINDESPIKLTTVEWVKNKIMASVLGDLYPVGSIYIGTQGTCPLASLIPGSTWQQIQGRYLLASGTLAGTAETYSATNTVASGAPNIDGGFMAHSGIANPTASGAFWIGSTYGNNGWNGTATQGRWYGFTAYNSNSTYGQSGAIRSPAYVVNVWRRTA